MTTQSTHSDAQALGNQAATFNPKKHQLVEIHWLDSGGLEGQIWQFHDDVEWERQIHYTAGYFIKKSADYLYTAQSLGQDQYGRIFRIPLTCIIGTLKFDNIRKYAAVTDLVSNNPGANTDTGIRHIRSLNQGLNTLRYIKYGETL